MKRQKTILISGCSSGIGKATAIALAEAGHNILAVNRKCSKSDSAFDEISQYGSGKKHHYYADLSDIDSIKKATEQIAQNHSNVNVLINNAGVFKTKETLSSDATELTMAVNLRAAALLTKSLLPILQNSSDPRVIFLSSELYKRAKIYPQNLLGLKKYNSSIAYANSKMLVNILAEALAEENKSILFYSVHPGVVASDAFRDYPKIMLKLLTLFLAKPEKGAMPVIRLALEETGEKSGSYFMGNKVKSIFRLSDYTKIKNKLIEWYDTL